MKTGLDKTKGFTLVEIMVVVSIVGFLTAVATPRFLESRNSSRTAICINNLRQIQSAKEQYSVFENAPDTLLIVNGSDLDDYIKGGFGSLSCPASGVYTINIIADDPTCIIANHAL